MVDGNPPVANEGGLFEKLLRIQGDFGSLALPASSIQQKIGDVVDEIVGENRVADGPGIGADVVVFLQDFPDHRMPGRAVQDRRP